MGRPLRMLVSDQKTAYHVISRTALLGLPFDDADKDMFVKILRKYASIYFADVLGFCFMSNHFHLVLQMHPEDYCSDEDIKNRFKMYYGKDLVFPEEKLSYFRKRWSNLSELVGEIKQTFSRNFNRKHSRKGTLWAERYKSVIVENGETLINCLAYVDLNPVRAGMVDVPEKYRWCSMGYHVQQKNKYNLLSLDFGLRDHGYKNDSEKFDDYRRYVYEIGLEIQTKSSGIKEKIVKKEKRRDFKLTKSDRFLYRTRYFTDSGIIGSKEFVKIHFIRFKHMFQSSLEKKPKKIRGFESMYSLRELRD
ncbi:MAG: hypothetical protein GY760_09300 [Deltaproteobacteria bacterium]|nr:hypothetical protein [Deltaproteobacteria bacterium]